MSETYASVQGIKVSQQKSSVSHKFQFTFFVR